MKYLKKYEVLDSETDKKLFNILEDIRVSLIIAKDPEKRFEYIKKIINDNFLLKDEKIVKDWLIEQDAKKYNI